MLNTTIDAVRAIFRSDPHVRPRDRTAYLQALRLPPDQLNVLLRSAANAKTQPQAPAPPETRLIRRAEAARRLSVSLRAIDNWARAGILHKVKLPGRVRACGFRTDEIDAVIRGRESTT